MNQFDLLIVDEAHHFPSSFWKNIVDFATESDCKVLFLTATPYRSDGKEVIPNLAMPISLDCNFSKWASKKYKSNVPLFFHLPLQEAQDK